MSSKAQLADYNKRLRSELNRKEMTIKNMMLSLANDRQIISNLRNSIKEQNIEKRKLESALKKSKRWYQIIIRI